MRTASAGLVLLSLLGGVSGLGSGCSDEDGGALVPEARGPRLVLQQADLSDAWSAFDVGPQAIADAPLGVRADPQRFGRRGGWKARFRRPGSATTRGPLVIESRADVFAEVEGAEHEFDAASEELEQREAVAAEPTGLGDESRAAATGGTGPGQFRSFTVFWRQANVTASVTANGFGDRITFEDVLRLAQRQQERIAAVARK